MTASQRQEFCVRWNSHLGSIGAAFPQLLAGQRFVDVTLACEGHQVHCHRLVLAACSSYFDSILAENPCKHPVIILPSEIKLWEIQALVDFMYKGEVNVTQAGLPQLLRCAEQLRIRGLYGSDAALNLNQLKALSNKAAVAAAAAANALHAGSGATNDSIETDDTATNSTTTTTATAASALQQLQASGMTAQELQLQHQQQQQQQQQQQLMLKKELPALHAVALQQQQQQQHQQLQQQQLQSNGTMSHNALQQNHLQQQLQLQQQQQQLKQATQGLTHVANAAAAVAAGATLTSHSNAATEEEESGDDSTSNAYDEYEKYMLQQKIAAGKLKSPSGMTNIAHPHMDSTIEDDHNYVAAHDEDSSYCASADTEHETSANSSIAALAQQGGDATGPFKRVRRSEASLAQAAKCVSKGQTFQTVSNMFNIPVSTIRFYMARKGILPRRKRGRGASSSNNTTNSAASATAAVMSQALAQLKRSESPTAYQQLPTGAAYKLAEQGAAHI